MPLSSSDDLLQLLYGGVTSDDALARALIVLAARFACRSAVLFSSDVRLPVSDVQLSYGTFDAGVQAKYMADYAVDDPAPAAMARLELGKAAATDRLFSPDERARNRFLNEFYHPLGLREALGGPITKEDGRVGIMAVHRGPDRSSFDNDEIAEFGRLLTHAARAHELRRAFFRVTAKAVALDRAVEPLAGGIMIFTPAGHMTHANAKAREILERVDGLALTRSGRLRAKHAAADAKLRACLEPASGVRGPIILRVPRDASARPYVVRLTAPAPDIAGWDGGSGVSAYIFDPDKQAGDVGAELAAALGLTASSGALVAALLAGKDLKAFAAATGITLSTAKFHLQAAFAATGTSRQVDLVRIAASVRKDLALET